MTAVATPARLTPGAAAVREAEADGRLAAVTPEAVARVAAILLEARRAAARRAEVAR